MVAIGGNNRSSGRPNSISGATDKTTRGGEADIAIVAAPFLLMMFPAIRRGRKEALAE